MPNAYLTWYKQKLDVAYNKKAQNKHRALHKGIAFIQYVLEK